MLLSDVQRTVDEFVADVACPSCNNLFSREDVSAILAAWEDPDELIDHLRIQHELVCGEFMVRREDYCDDC